MYRLKLEKSNITTETHVIKIRWWKSFCAADDYSTKVM